MIFISSRHQLLYDIETIIIQKIITRIAMIFIIKYDANVSYEIIIERRKNINSNNLICLLMIILEF